MCGFFLGWDLSGQDLVCTADHRELACRYLGKRGPDDLNIEEGQAGFAIHTRLTIRGGAAGKQPIRSKESLFVYNGELYNDIGQHTSDTEYFFQNFRSVVDGSLGLDGIFAAALIDTRSNKVFLVRDSWGTKPLFYLIDSGVLYASSSLRLLSKVAPIEIDNDAINKFLTLGFFPGDTTPFSKIRKARPGAVTGICAGTGGFSCTVQKMKTEARNFAGAQSLASALSTQLISDVPIGLLLSGGVDSSILAKLLDNRALVDCYNVTSDSFQNLDEKENLKTIEHEIQNNVIQIDMGALNVPRLFELAITELEIPVADSSIALNYAVYESMRNAGITVCLTGVGADELFGGYPRYRILPYLGLIKALKLIFPKGFWKLASFLFSNPRIKKFLRNGCSNYIDLFSDSPQSELSQYFVPLNKKEILKFERFEYLPNSLLSFTDAISMAHSIEARVPYLSSHIATPEILTNNYFTPRKKFLKEIRKKLYKKKFDEAKKGFAIKNDELCLFWNRKEVRNRHTLAKYTLEEWLRGLDIHFDSAKR